MVKKLLELFIVVMFFLITIAVEERRIVSSLITRYIYTISLKKGSFMNDKQKIGVVAVLVAVAVLSVYLLFYKKQHVPMIVEQEISVVQEPEVIQEQDLQAALQELRSKEDFEKLLARKDRVVVIKFSTEWCPPCKALKPIYKTTSELEGKNAYFAAVDLELFPDKTYLDQFGVQGFPTIIVFDNGKEVDRMVGFPNKEGLTPKQVLKEFVSKSRKKNR